MHRFAPARLSRSPARSSAAWPWPAPRGPISPTCRRRWAPCRRREAELIQARPNKGGHRERAINFVNAAISETEAGINYAGN